MSIGSNTGYHSRAARKNPPDQAPLRVSGPGSPVVEQPFNHKTLRGY